MHSELPFKLLFAIILVMLIIAGVTNLFLPMPVERLKFDYGEQL